MPISFNRMIGIRVLPSKRKGVVLEGEAIVEDLGVKAGEDDSLEELTEEDYALHEELEVNRVEDEERVYKFVGPKGVVFGYDVGNDNYCILHSCSTPDGCKASTPKAAPDVSIDSDSLMLFMKKEVT